MESAELGKKSHETAESGTHDSSTKFERIFIFTCLLND